MKVLLINGSPHSKGCTATALGEVAGELEKSGIETEMFWIGHQPIYGCTGCRACRTSGRCVFGDDPTNSCIDRLTECDGVVIGSPVYYAGPNGALCAMLDRAFYAAGQSLAGKPAAAVVSCRRGGASAAFDRLNKYFTISRMPVVSSQYWNAVHGNTPQEVRQDEEGMQIMRTLGRNMAWMLRLMENGEESLPLPAAEEHVWTNFIRE